SMRFPAGIKLIDLEPTLKRLEEFEGLRNQINEDQATQHCFPESFKGTGTDTNRISQTAKAYEAIEGSGLPRALKNYLLSPNIRERMNVVREFSDELAKQSVTLSSLISGFQDLGKVKLADWYSEANDQGSIPIPSILSRTELALA